VDATFCASLGDEGLAALAACPALEEVQLGAYGAVSGAGVAGLAGLAALRRLDLSYTALADPAPVAPVCARLTSLVLSNNCLMPPHALRAVLGALAAGAAPSSLVELDVSYCAVPGDVVAALAAAPGLRALAANGCGGVDDALWPLLHGPGEGELTYLSLVGSRRVEHGWLGMAPAAQASALGLGAVGEAADGEGFVGVPTPLRGLVRLQLGLCGLRSAALALPELRELRLNSCAALASLRLRCPALRTLSLAACPRLTPADVAALVAGCPALQELDLQGLPGAITPEVVAALHAACPSLETVRVTRPRAQPSWSLDAE
jgi:hypothetical protein